MAESSPNGPLVDCRLPGAIAQLAERFHGMEEVEGSIPSSSTSGNLCLAVAGESVQPQRVRYHEHR